MYDSVEGNQSIIVISEKEVMFNESRNGIYYHDLEYRHLVLVNRVEENRERFSCREMSGDREARWALAMFRYPSQKTFEHMVRNINNCPVTIEDVRNANTIYGCNVLTLKGETFLQQPKRVQAEYIEV